MPFRRAGNFHPDWGYFAPLPSFRRTIGVGLVGAATGAIAGAMVVISLLEPPGSNPDTPISAHALVGTAPIIASQAPAMTNTSLPAVAALASPRSAGTVGSAEKSTEMTSSAIASASPDTAVLPDTTPINDEPAMSAAAAAKSAPDGAAAKNDSVRASRTRTGKTVKGFDHKRRFARSFQVFPESGFFDVNHCCAWTTPPMRRAASEW
jgi:hypothetical protein